jgi:hypothetical protein
MHRGQNESGPPTNSVKKLEIIGFTHQGILCTHRVLPGERLLSAPSRIREYLAGVDSGRFGVLCLFAILPLTYNERTMQILR